MGSCSDMTSSSYRCRYVSWCVDPAETAAPSQTDPNQQPAESGLLPLGYGGRDEETTVPHPCAQDTFPKRKLQKTLRRSHPRRSAFYHGGRTSTYHSDEGEDDDSITKSQTKDPNHPETDGQSRQEGSEDAKQLVRRSSPLVRRYRPISWLRGGSAPPHPSSSASPPSGSPPPDQHGCLPATSTTEQEYKASSCQDSFPVQVDEKQRCISLSSSLNSLPSKCQEEQAKEVRGQSLNSCTAPKTPDLSTSDLCKERSSSGVPDFPAGIFKTSCELEKENAHFVVVDMVLEVLEGVKWTLSFEQRTSTMEKQQHTHSTMSRSSVQGSPPHEAHNPEQDNSMMSYMHTHSGQDLRMAHTDTHFYNGNQQSQGKEDEQSGSGEVKYQMKSLSVLSTDSGFEDCVLDTTLTPTESLRNAEWLAQQLVSEFKKMWLPPRELRRGRQSLRTSLQELPGTGAVVVNGGNLMEEIRLRTRMRGSLNWAPPRFQIIFTAQPSHRRSDVVAMQHFLCAGCGTEVEPRYIKKLRYCEYLGRYFCDCCHSGSESVIPGRVLSCWDFSRYSVSDFSKQLLDSVWHQPLFDLTSVGKKLCSKVKELEKLRELQEQLMGIKKLLKACRLSERVMAELQQLPAHLMEQPLLFSMDDLLRLKKGQLVAQVRAALHSAIEHVEKCQLCTARGFICEFCHERDIIFPFQKDICKRCIVCKACFHKGCFAEKKCPKCARIQSRKKGNLHA